jgi:hypothetical protein
MEMQPAVLPPHFGGETFCPARCCHYSGGLFFPYNDRAIGCKNEDCAEPQNMSTSGASRVGSHLAAFKTWFPLAAVSVFATSLAACGGGTGTPATTTPTPPVSCSGSTSSVVPVAKAAAPASAQALSPLSPQYFGMHIDVGAIATPPTLAWPAIPFGMIRMHSTETRWNDIDQGGGVYDFSTLDQWRSLYQQNEVGNPAGNYQLVFTMYSTPAYISSNPTDACDFSSTSGHPAGSCDPPADVCADGTGTDATFTNFVTALAQHMNNDSLPKIHYWEIWNEPNDVTFWNGTLPQLARMAQDARCVIVGTNCNSLTTYPATGIDPTSQMLTPPPVTIRDETNPALDSPSGWMTAYLAAGGGQYADIIGFHGYVEPGDPVEGVLTVAQSIEPVASAAGFSSKPIWDTELGYFSADVSDPYTQAGWLAKAYLLQAGLGIQRVAWFEYGASNVGTLTLPGGGLNQAGIDYSVLYYWLGGATATGPCTSSGTVWTCGFTSASGAQAEAVWDSAQSCSVVNSSESCTFSNFSPNPVYTTYEDLQGGSHTISGSSVSIGVEPILLESP